MMHEIEVSRITHVINISGPSKELPSDDITGELFGEPYYSYSLVTVTY